MMFRSFFFASVLCVLTFSVQGTDFSKTTEKGLIFYASFDKDINADFAAGDSRGSMQGDGGQDGAFVPGKKNQGLLIGADDKGEKLRVIKYEGPENVSAAGGTMMFWFKPVTWQKNRQYFQHLVSAYGDHSIFCYQLGSGQFGIYEGVARHSNTIRNRCTEWTDGEWMHCAVAWDKGSVKLYIDGKSAGVLARDPKWQNARWHTLAVGAMLWGKEVVRGYSVIDELKIYDHPLSAEKIASASREFSDAAQGEKEASLLRIGRSTAVPDGTINDGEYAASGNGFSVLEGHFSPVQGTWHFGFDDETLYVALQTPISKTPVIEATQRDGEVYSDDSVELDLSPDDRTICQLIVNPNGVVFDNFIDKVYHLDWNLKNLKIGNKISDGIWTCELAIPLAELPKPRNGIWHFTICRAFLGAGDISRGISLAPVRKERGFRDRAKYIAMIPDAKAPHYSVFYSEEVAKGKIKIDFRAPDRAKIRVVCASSEQIWLDERFSPKDGKGTVKGTGAAEGTISTEILDGGKCLYRSELVGRTPPPLRIQYIYTDRDKQQLHLAIKNEGGQSSCVMLAQMKDRTNGRCIAEQRFPIRETSPFVEKIWDVSSLPPGDYDFVGTPLDASGKSTGTAYTQIFRKPGAAEPWRNNTLGIVSGEVPPPWVPLKAQDKRVDSLMQSYRFESSILPAWFGTHSKNMLVRPAQLLINGSPVENATFKLTKSTPEKAVIEAVGTLKKLQVRVLYEIEFDGMIWMTMQFSSKDFVIDRLEMVFPLDGAESNLVHGNDGKDTGTFQEGASGVLKKEVWRKDLYSSPSFWVGGNQLGLCWFAEGLKNWNNKDASRSVEILPGDGERLLKFTLIDLPVRLNDSMTIQFGMQGSPVKPSRNLNCVRQWNNHPDGRVYFDYHDPSPEFFNREEFDRRHRICSARNVPYFYYCSSNAFSPYAPEWAWYATEWIHGMIGAYTIESAINTVEERNHDIWTLGCLSSKSFFDFKTWQIGNLITSPVYDLPNLYNDCVGPLLCSNTAHGCGWRDAKGALHPTLNVLAVREFHKRMYSLGKKKSPDFLHVLHMTGKGKMLPVTAFADAVVDGESFFNDEVVDKENYYGIFTPEMFRANYQTNSCGYDLVYIPQLVRAAVMRRPDRVKLWKSNPPAPAMLQALRHFCGYALAHNVLIWPWDDWTLAYTLRLHDTEEKHLGGFDNLKFISYWENDKPYTVSSKNPARTMVSALVRGEKAVFILMNDTDAKETVQVNVSAEKLLGRKGQISCQAFEPEFPAVLKENCFSTELPARSFAVFLVGFKP